MLRHPRRPLRASSLLLALVAPAFAAGCGDDTTGAGGGGDEGSATTTTATVAASGSVSIASASSGTTASASSGGGSESGSGGGSEGGGGAGIPCEAGCPEELPVCQDGLCVAGCDEDRVVCDTSDGIGSCCEAGALCCPGATPGTSDCRASCDTRCDDGTICGAGEICEQAVEGDTFTCATFAACGLERLCGELCCPLGSRCDEGECKLADIYADGEYLRDTMLIVNETFSESSCELFEECINAPGDRRLLKFGLRTPNDGEGDLFLGNTPCEEGDDDPECAAVPEDLYLYSSCHAHYHFTSYASYRLLDAEGRVAATGHKQAFCLMDLEGPQGQGDEDIYDCGYQGIQSGWADIYDNYLPCQWIDVTDVGPGDYRLEITLNTDRALAESDYTNNALLVDVHIQDNSCAGGCAPWNAGVCVAGDPMARAGDGICDCNGVFEWDAADCAFCDGCFTTSCPGGCSDVDADGCCGAEDTCGLALDGVCNCGGDAAWDAADCGHCISADVDCPDTDSCPFGCGWEGNFQCGGSAEQEGQNDGYCDCTDDGWDVVDCFSCSENCGQ